MKRGRIPLCRCICSLIHDLFPIWGDFCEFGFVILTVDPLIVGLACLCVLIAGSLYLAPACCTSVFAVDLCWFCDWSGCGAVPTRRDTVVWVTGSPFGVEGGLYWCLLDVWVGFNGVWFGFLTLCGCDLGMWSKLKLNMKCVLCETMLCDFCKFFCWWIACRFLCWDWPFCACWLWWKRFVKLCVCYWNFGLGIVRVKIVCDAAGLCGLAFLWIRFFLAPFLCRYRFLL